MRNYTKWHHAPLHVFVPGRCYMVTSGTLHKQHFFRNDLKMLSSVLLEMLEHYGWEPRAWAALSNHYHFMAVAPPEENNLSRLLRQLHSRTAREVNRAANVAGRQVWHQYWDKCITFEKSYLARLKYVTNNAVHHGLVQEATHYPYCSASWMHRNCDRGFIRKLESFGCDRLHEPDDYDPVL